MALARPKGEKVDSAVRVVSNYNITALFPYSILNRFIAIVAGERAMTDSVDELRSKVEQYRSDGLNTQQIADEMSLHRLLSNGSPQVELVLRTVPKISELDGGR